MKKFLSFMLFVSSCAATQAIHVYPLAETKNTTTSSWQQRKAQKLSFVIDAFENRSYREPAELINKWIKLESKRLKMWSQTLASIAKQAHMPKYQNIAYRMKSLADALGSLSPVTKDIKIPGRSLSRLVQLKAQKAALMAEQFEALSNQAPNKQAEAALQELAQDQRTMANAIRSALESRRASSTETHTSGISASLLHEELTSQD